MNIGSPIGSFTPFEPKDNEKGLLAGSRDSGLTTKGMLHGYQLASNLHTTIGGQNIKRVIASPLKRAHKTARICAHELSRLHDKKLFVHTSKVLQERHFGKLEGTLIEDIPKLAISYRNTSHGMIYVEEAHEAESMEKFYTRAEDVLNFLRKESKKMTGDTLVVAHAGIAQMIYLRHHNRHWEDIFQIPILQNGHFLIID